MTEEVEVWLWRLAGGDPGLLSPDEHARAGRFVFARDRDRYVAGRARLREIIGRRLGRAPADLQFRYGANGKPEIDGVEFNLSHTGDLAALAVSSRLPLGLDIEAIRPIEDGVAQSYFAPSELRALQRTPPGERMAAFYRCWTRKEAYLKGRGAGLATDLRSFEVTLGREGPPRVLRCASGRSTEWRLVDLPTPEGVAGALAVQSGGRSISLRLRGADFDQEVQS